MKSVAFFALFLASLFFVPVSGHSGFYEHPEFRQNGSPICGPSCFISVIHKFRRFTDEADRLRITRELGYNGVYSSSLVQSFRNFGFKSDQWSPATIEELEGWSERGVSFILNWHNGNGYHYSVFEGLKDGRIYVMDPNYGHVNYPVAEFLRNWVGPAVWVSQ